MGIGFAIPVDTVRRVVNELIRYGAVVQPTLGINVADDQTTRGLFAQLGLPLEGVLVAVVAPLSPPPSPSCSRRRATSGPADARRPRDRGGRRAGEAIENLLSAIEERRVGEEVPLKVLRGYGPQREQTLRAKLVSRERLETLERDGCSGGLI